jgi:hypothetical protein
MKTISTLSTQEDAVIHFIEMLDIDMINTLLDEGRTYQDMEKYLFIRKLGYAFDEFLESGDTFLQTKKGNCEAVTCNFKCKGYSFYGNNSGKHIDLIIEKDLESKVLDIYECLYFLSDGQEKTTNYKTRVKIDRE